MRIDVPEASRGGLNAGAESGQAELEALVRYHQDKYYNAEPEIPDHEFDSLWDELRSIEPDNPLFSEVSPESTDGFPKAAHVIPMGSQEKAADPESFSAWAKKMSFDLFFVQYKLDGASLELQYSKGVFSRAVTRGDGKIGDDISFNAKNEGRRPCSFRRLGP